MDFSKALQALKQGKRIAREGWNGRNQYVYLLALMGMYEPCVVLHNAQGKDQPGWVCSQGDLLADDWVIVNGPV